MKNKTPTACVSASVNPATNPKEDESVKEGEGGKGERDVKKIIHAFLRAANGGKLIFRA